MICYQNKSKPSLNEFNHQNMNQSSNNNFLTKSNVSIKSKKKESTGCFCFSFTKKNSIQENKIDQSRMQPDQSVKDEALRMSREIAQKSFKNITRLKSSTMLQREQENKKMNKISSNNIYLAKIQTKQAQKLYLDKNKQKKTQQFNMNRLTFSAVNKSYQKTVNTTINTTLNQSISIDNSNLLGSLVSLKKEKQKNQQESFSRSIKVELIENKSKVQKYKPVSSVREISVKKINILKTTPEFEPIKQENEQSQMKMHKIIKMNGKKSQSPKLDRKSIDSLIRLNQLPVKKVQTQEQILSNQNDEIDRIRYEYSSIVIDYFNPTPSIMEKLNHQNKVIELQQQIKTENILPPQQKIQIEKSPINNEISQSSMFQNNSISISQSNVRLLNNIPSSVSSLQSNLLSFSFNNNNCNDFSCSFESIAKKETRFLQKNQNIFDGLGLSLINQNQQSEINKNQSQVSEYHPQNINNFNQSSDQI